MVVATTFFAQLTGLSAQRKFGQMDKTVRFVRYRQCLNLNDQHLQNAMTTKARQMLVRAFNELVLERRYEEIHIADIIKRADVSRSTFYEHFHNKEEILCHNLRAVFIPIAEACVGTGSRKSLVDVLAHFTDVQPLAIAYFSSPLSQVMSELLGHLIDERLPSSTLCSGISIPASLLSMQVAESTLGLVKAWLNSTETRIDAYTIADQVISSSRAVLIASHEC